MGLILADENRITGMVQPGQSVLSVMADMASKVPNASIADNWRFKMNDSVFQKANSEFTTTVGKKLSMFGVCQIEVDDTCPENTIYLMPK